MPEAHATRDVPGAPPPPEPPLVQRIGVLFADVLHVDVPSPDTDLMAAGLLDSLGLVELLLQLEEAFGVEITLDTLDVEHFRSLQTIAAFMVAAGVTPAGDGS